jgi:hypothetical protein
MHMLSSVHGRDRDLWSGAGPVEYGHITRLVYQAWRFVNILIHIKAFSNKTVQFSIICIDCWSSERFSKRWQGMGSTCTNWLLYLSLCFHL